MKIKHLFLLALLSLVFITSCSETKVDGPFSDWENRNLAFVDSIEQVYDVQKIPDYEQDIVVTGNKIGRFKVESVSTLNEPVYVYYKVIDRAQDDSLTPIYTDSVEVYYRGMLMNEKVIGALPLEPRYITRAYADLTVFDKTFENENPNLEVDKPVKFEVNRVVPGFTRILQEMSAGDRWEVYIPSKAGYGGDNRGDLPAHSTLIFDLTFHQILR